MKTIFKKMLIMVLVCLPLIVLSACGNSDPVEANPPETAAIQPEKAEQQIQADPVEACAQALLNLVSEPGYGSVGGEWSVIGLNRWGGALPANWTEDYWQALTAYVQDCGGVLDTRKYTEYSRVILALTAIGKNPAEVEGYNLLAPLADYEQTVFQGLNGPAFALLALDSGNYEIPQNQVGSTQATRELYLDYILDMESPAGGWGLTGSEPDVDITAMVLQALAKYQEQDAVAAVTERALEYLSTQQNEQGSFTSHDVQCSESVSQVILALAELGISLEDSRFVKNGNTLLDALLQFQTAEGGFSHLQGDELNLLSTEQALCALVSVMRTEQGEPSLYRMY